MIELPLCRWRGDELPNGNHVCGSPKIGSPNGATVEDCRDRCTLCDHPPEGTPATRPGLFKRTVRFATSAARHLWEGMPRATEEEQARRLKICRQCVHHDPARGCLVCGCTGLKLEWAGEKCPQGKWEA